MPYLFYHADGREKAPRFLGGRSRWSVLIHVHGEPIIKLLASNPSRIVVVSHCVTFLALYFVPQSFHIDLASFGISVAHLALDDVGIFRQSDPGNAHTLATDDKRERSGNVNGLGADVATHWTNLVSRVSC
jgi:hypothetical protein